MIRLTNVSKNYSNGVEALKNINMEIDDGEFEIGRASCRERV